MHSNKFTKILNTLVSSNNYQSKLGLYLCVLFDMNFGCGLILLYIVFIILLKAQQQGSGRHGVVDIYN